MPNETSPCNNSYLPNPDESLFSATRNGMFSQIMTDPVDTTDFNPLMRGNPNKNKGDGQ
jgi:hypothetical protein